MKWTNEKIEELINLVDKGYRQTYSKEKTST
jgi:hypothetical protein